MSGEIPANLFGLTSEQWVERYRIMRDAAAAGAEVWLATPAVGCELVNSNRSIARARPARPARPAPVAGDDGMARNP